MRLLTCIALSLLVTSCTTLTNNSEHTRPSSPKKLQPIHSVTTHTPDSFDHLPRLDQGPIPSTESGSVIAVSQETGELPAQSTISGATRERTEADVPDIPERLLPTGIVDIGSTDAPVTLLVFTEHHCDYCREFHREYIPRLQEEFIRGGVLRLQLIPYSLQKYEYSAQAAASLLCAGLQGRGLAMHTLLSQGAIHQTEILLHAEALKLDTEQFVACLEGQQVESLLVQQKSLAKSFNVSLVPSMYLNGEKIVGLPFYPDLRGMIEAMIN